MPHQKNIIATKRISLQQNSVKRVSGRCLMRFSNFSSETTISGFSCTACIESSIALCTFCSFHFCAGPTVACHRLNSSYTDCSEHCVCKRHTHHRAPCPQVWQAGHERFPRFVVHGHRREEGLGWKEQQMWSALERDEGAQRSGTERQ